jgi:hypothetical protein
MWHQEGKFELFRHLTADLANWIILYLSPPPTIWVRLLEFVGYIEVFHASGQITNKMSHSLANLYLKFSRKEHNLSSHCSFFKQKNRLKRLPVANISKMPLFYRVYLPIFNQRYSGQIDVYALVTKRARS